MTAGAGSILNLESWIAAAGRTPLGVYYGGKAIRPGREVYAMKDILRREFLQSAGLAVGVLPAVAGRGSPRSEPAAGGTRLLSGCCAYSYHPYLEPGKMTMEEFILKAAGLGVVGVDMTAYYLKSTDPAYLVGLRHLAFKHGVPFSGAACGTEMCLADSAKRAAATAEVKKWVDVTEWLGASHLRVFGGTLPAGATDDQGVRWVAEVMKPGADYSGAKGITLGIESHGGITSRAENILEILRLVRLSLRRMQPGHHPLQGRRLQAD